jgi:hypothetical protein
MSGAPGTGIVVVAAALGAIVSLATKHEPGSLLGGFVVAGALAAGFAVRQRSAYLLIPVPALSYVVFALAVGLLREQSAPSSTGLTVNAAQWVANGFLTMAAATVLAVAITAGRWLLARYAGAAGVGARRDPDARPGPEGRPPRQPRPDAGPDVRPDGGPSPQWPDDRWERRAPGDPLAQGARWAQGDELRGPGYQQERGRSDPRRQDPRRQDPRRADWDRRPPPGPPSFGSPRDLAAGR